jgi:hypothetical protein
MTATNKKQLGDTSGALPANCAGPWMWMILETSCCPFSSCGERIDSDCFEEGEI